MKITKGKGWGQVYIEPTWLIHVEWDLRHWFIGLSLYIWDGGWNLSLSLLCLSVDIGQDDCYENWLEQKE